MPYSYDYGIDCAYGVARVRSNTRSGSFTNAMTVVPNFTGPDGRVTVPPASATISARLRHVGHANSQMARTRRLIVFFDPVVVGHSMTVLLSHRRNQQKDSVYLPSGTSRRRDFIHAERFAVKSDAAIQIADTQHGVEVTCHGLNSL